jgi:hypothetical protein
VSPKSDAGAERKTIEYVTMFLLVNYGSISSFHHVMFLDFSCSVLEKAQ